MSALATGSLLFLGAAKVGGAAAPPLADAVRLQGDLLTVRLADVPLSDVLAELGRQSGAEIRGRAIGSGRVTATFEEVPLPKALARLLPTQNFALVYEEGGRLKAVRLLGGTDGVAVSVPAAPPPPGPSGLEALLELIVRHPPVTIAGTLVDALGVESVPLLHLLDVGLRHEDSVVRGEAVRTGMATLQAEPEFRNAVVEALGQVDNAALMTSLRATSPHAEEVARSVLISTQVPEVRLKASSVLQRLRTAE